MIVQRVLRGVIDAGSCLLYDLSMFNGMETVVSSKTYKFDRCTS